MPARERPRPVTLRCRGNRVDRAALRRLTDHVLDTEGSPPERGIGLVLVGDTAIRRLNRQWRGKDRPTDVLSFPLGEAPPLPAGAEDPERDLLGEVVISLPRCREQASERNVDAGVELVRLLIHGALHVLGYDHETAPEARRMIPRERAYRAWASRRGIGPGLLTSS